MAKKPFNVLSATALAAVLASSAIVPTAVFAAETTQSVQNVIVEHEGEIFELSYEDYTNAKSAGVNFGEVKYVVSSNGKQYKYSDFTQAKPVGSTVDGTLELLEKDPTNVQDVTPGKVIIGEDGKPEYVPPVVNEDFEVTDIAAINETSVTVNFPSDAGVTAEGLNGKTLTLTAGDSTFTATYKADSFAAGEEETTATFELADGEALVAGTSYTVTSDDLTITEAAASVTYTAPKTITAVTSPETITVVEGSEVVLPTEVEVTYDDESTGKVAVTWDNEVDTSIPGTTDLVGTVEGTEETAALQVVVVAQSAYNVALAKVKTTAEGADAEAFKAALEEPVLNLKLNNDNIAAYKAAIAEAFSVSTVEEIQAIIDATDAKIKEDEEAEDAELAAAKAAQLEAIMNAKTVTAFKNALNINEDQDHPVVIKHVLKTTADLNAYRTKITADKPADLDAVQAIIDTVNTAKVESAVAKAETSKKQTDLDAATAARDAVMDVNNEFDTPAEGETKGAFEARIDAVQDQIDAAKALADAIKAVNDEKAAETSANLLTALQKDVLGLENVVEENADAYLGALKAAVAENADFAFATPEEIQAFVNNVNAEVKTTALADAIEAVNDEKTAETSADLLTALQKDVLDLENVVAENADAYLVALKAAVTENADFTFETPEEIQEFVDKVNAQVLLDDATTKVEALTDEDDVLQGDADVAAANIAAAQEAVNKLPAGAVKDELQAGIDAAKDLLIVRDVNLTNGEGNLRDYFFNNLSYAPFTNLGVTKGTEVAKLVILDRPVEGFADVPAIKAAIDTAITEYNALLADVNSASTISEMRTALQAVLDKNKTPGTITVEQAETALEKRPDTGYKSVTGILAAITPTPDTP